MTSYTINQAMVLQKALRGRLGELSALRAQCATKERYYGEIEKVVEPLYDFHMLDARCVEIENFLLEVDTAIKQSNAITQISVEGDAQALMKPLK